MGIATVRECPSAAIPWRTAKKYAPATDTMKISNATGFAFECSLLAKSFFASTSEEKSSSRP